MLEPIGESTVALNPNLSSVRVGTEPDETAAVADRDVVAVPEQVVPAGVPTTVTLILPPQLLIVPVLTTRESFVKYPGLGAAFTIDAPALLVMLPELIM